MDINVKSINNIIYILDKLLNNSKYLNEFELIENLKIRIKNLTKNEESLNIENLDYLKEKFYYLEEKYNDIFDLAYYFDPIYITLKNNIHKKEIESLRKKQRKQKEGFRNV